MNTQTWWLFSTCLSSFKYGVILGIYEKHPGRLYWDGFVSLYLTEGEFCVSPRFGREDFVVFASMWGDSNEIWYFWWFRNLGDESPPPDIYETSLNHGIYVLPYQLDYPGFFFHQQYEIQKKSNQTKPKTQLKGAWCNLLRVLGVLLAPMASQVLHSMAPLPGIGAHGMVGQPSAKMHGCKKTSSWPHQEKQCPETNSWPVEHQ